MEYPNRPTEVTEFLSKTYQLRKADFNDDLWRRAYEDGYLTALKCAIPEIKVEGTRTALSIAMLWADALIGPYDIPDGNKNEHQRKMIGSFKSGITGAFFGVLAKRSELV